jgi:hypothetical protein
LVPLSALPLSGEPSPSRRFASTVTGFPTTRAAHEVRGGEAGGTAPAKALLLLPTDSELRRRVAWEYVLGVVVAVGRLDAAIVIADHDPSCRIQAKEYRSAGSTCGDGAGRALSTHREVAASGGRAGRGRGVDGAAVGGCTERQACGHRHRAGLRAHSMVPRPVWEVPGEMARGRGRGRGLPPPSHTPPQPPDAAAEEEDTPLDGAFLDTLSKHYLAESDGADVLEGLARVQQSLNSNTCLICLDPIPGAAPIWSCSAGCHDTFHLMCIQSWAKSEADRNAYRKV